MPDIEQLIQASTQEELEQSLEALRNLNYINDLISSIHKPIIHAIEIELDYRSIFKLRK